STYSTSGVYTDVLTAVNGCDSTVTTDLTVGAAISGSQTLSLCSGESVTVGTSTYSTSGVYTDVLTAVNGCDSTVTTDLTVGAAISGSQTLSICSGESVTVGTNTYTVSGVYTDVLTAVNGCDSTVTTDLTVHAVIDVSTTVSGITITANAAPASYQWVDCTNGFLPVSGEINQSYVANVNGNYAVIVTQNGCADTSICVSITMNGLGEWSQNHQLLVYPNPATGVVMIQADGIMNQVEVMNSMGEVVMRETAGEKQLQLDLGNLSPGIYYLLVSTDNERTVRKIVKK
ncbi:MAG: T9SS type A sorting domain-containing protein, partial [Bacteroidetes bacterium]|nr:T9SS type A sorting domain-containing protein [Bacteroidota bacterium]